MRKRVLLLAVILGLLLPVVVFISSSKANSVLSSPLGPIEPPASLNVYTSRTMASSLLNTSNQMVFGPHICTAFGDPFSPLNSPWEPGFYTYQYRILVPGDYPSDVLRVELFDPDSINQAGNDFTIAHTAIALEQGFPATEAKSCVGESANQINLCAIETGELNLLITNPSLNIDKVNPFWFVRLDENRGTGGAPGNGTCGSPGSYDPAYNTTTLYQLYYYRQNPDESIERVDLASYTGQVGNGVRDSGDHQTDLRWVSPGGQPSFDQSVFVPVDPGSAKSFELNIATDLPNIRRDPETWDGYVYLDITTLSGAAKNGFEIWAGPPDYVSQAPSEGNARNLYILNNPNSHHSGGIGVFALGRLPQSSNHSQPFSRPLVDIGPEYAGESIFIKHFDPDAGSQPPITFYFDTIADSDWSVSFGAGTDPEGRCFDGGSSYANECNDRWVEPPYEIVVPGRLNDCDYQNPTPEACTPFYGGRLMVRYDDSLGDNTTWETTPSEAPPGNTGVGCTAFPIGLQEGVRSLTDANGGNPFPDASEFDYPLSPPVYTDFPYNVPQIPLPFAEQGYVYKVVSGPGEGNFAWLVWNTGISASSQTLANSLTWPGDSGDYTDHGDGGQIIPGSGYNHVVRGYVEPGDPTDQALHLGDWIAGSSGSINSATEDVLKSHVDTGRALRLPIWQTSTLDQFPVAGFVVVRIRGYSLGQSQEDNWLLLEVFNLDTSCSQTTIEPWRTYLPVITKSNNQVVLLPGRRPQYTGPIMTVIESTNLNE